MGRPKGGRRPQPKARPISNSHMPDDDLTEAFSPVSTKEWPRPLLGAEWDDNGGMFQRVDELAELGYFGGSSWRSDTFSSQAAFDPELCGHNSGSDVHTAGNTANCLAALDRRQESRYAETAASGMGCEQSLGQWPAEGLGSQIGQSGAGSFFEREPVDDEYNHAERVKKAGEEQRRQEQKAKEEATRKAGLCVWQENRAAVERTRKRVVEEQATPQHSPQPSPRATTPKGRGVGAARWRRPSRPSSTPRSWTPRSGSRPAPARRRKRDGKRPPKSAPSGATDVSPSERQALFASMNEEAAKNRERALRELDAVGDPLSVDEVGTSSEGRGEESPPPPKQACVLAGKGSKTRRG